LRRRASARSPEEAIEDARRIEAGGGGYLLDGKIGAALEELTRRNQPTPPAPGGEAAAGVFRNDVRERMRMDVKGPGELAQ